MSNADNPYARFQSQSTDLLNQAQVAQGYIQQRAAKDPTVTDAQDAIAALRKRLDVIKSELAKVPRLQAEQARIERMLAAAAPEEK